jgi:hypothetical protein
VRANYCFAFWWSQRSEDHRKIGGGESSTLEESEAQFALLNDMKSTEEEDAEARAGTC